ncbi:hypothetical protein [Sphingobacterium bovistauri]|uniref:Uncharacterized protein n=1 Tax=Sphingobacterium bovistauri TaxID=2781959 RepID=A0ABS7Z408_9SPHI|nr:hypothetical protein [Sphingobacterium bovistauri]MCA5003610.1 hypothetical protein [Sphingobacterium bovistauri]
MALKRIIWLTLLLNIGVIKAQSINTETVDYQILLSPKFKTEINDRSYKINLLSPYNLTKEQVIENSKKEFQYKLSNFDALVEKSKLEFNEKLKTYDDEVVLAKEKFEIENAAFKKLSLLERLALTEQNKNPKLRIPAKPEYFPPSKPVYSEPNLNNYLIIDNSVLESQIQISGFTKTSSFYDINIQIDKLNLIDNNNQTHGNQPTSIHIKKNGQELLNHNIFTDYKLVSSSPSNSVNKVTIEKSNINNIVKEINVYLNEQLGYQSIDKSIKLYFVKNKDGKYDDLEKAHIYATTNLKKINPANPAVTESAIAGLKKALDVWATYTTKIDYKDKKAVYNSKISTMIYFNLINLNLALDNKSEAEKWLNQMQENIIYMDLSSSENNELKNIEKEIYK